MTASPVEQLMASVVSGGYCIGCGLCAAVDGSPLQMRLDETGAYQAELRDPLDTAGRAASVLEVCPFSGEGPDENDLAAKRFGAAPWRDDIGHHLGTYAGYVEEGRFRIDGSSGGMAKWILAELLETGQVDHVLHVRASDDEAPAGAALFEYVVESRGEDVQRGSRAAYYPVEMSGVIDFLRRNPARYAITGVPCFIKGVRRMAEVDAVVAERIRYTVGIICGHLKTAGYAEALGWQLGVPPDDLTAIDFRTKIPGRRAPEKGVTAFDEQGRAHGPAVVQDLYGTKYQNGFFKYSACNYCDDVVAETADVAVGDAWLPGYTDSGNSVVVVRDRLIHELIDNAIHAGRLSLDAIEPRLAGASQKGGLRDRREGLSYRLHLAERAGRWYPPKRVAPSSDLPLDRRALYRLRMVIAQRSSVEFLRAKREDDLPLFLRRMSRWTKLYEATETLERKHIKTRNRAGRLKRRVVPRRPRRRGASR